VSFLLLAAALMVALLWPGEVFFESRALCLALVAAAGLWQRCRLAPKGWLAAALVPLTLSAAIGACAQRSARIVLLWALAAVAGLLCAQLEPGRRAALVRLLAGCGIALGAAGLYQYFWGFEHQLAALAQLRAPDGFLAPARVRLLSGRIYATYALPTTLAGTLAALLPLQIAELLGAAGRRRALWACGAGLTAAALILTGSYGGLLVLLAGAAWIGRQRLRRWLWILAAAAGAVAALAVRRGFWLWELEAPAHPGLLRLSHWSDAAELSRLHPLGGIGPGNFAVAVTAVQGPDAPASLYAHSAPLQLLAEAGVLGLPLLALLVWLAIDLRRGAIGKERWGAALAAAVILAHNLIDIGFYFDSTAWMTAALLGLALPRAPAARPGRGAVIGSALAAALGWVLLTFFADRARFEAQRELELSRLAAAGAALDQSARFDPWAPETRQLQALLSERQAQPARVRAQAWERAVRADPWRAALRARHAQALFETGWGVAALAQAQAALELFPAQPRYAALRDRIAQSLAASPGGKSR